MKLFDRIIVKISIDSTNVQHQKMKLQLVEPKISGFSVEPEKAEEKAEQESPVSKKAKK